MVSAIPAIDAATNKSQFNDAIMVMLNAAGPTAIAASPLPDTLAPELKRNRDFGWINDTIFRTDVRIILDTIKNNFLPHAECWVQNAFDTSGTGWLTLPHDSVELAVNTYTNFPDEAHRLLMLFKYWNVVRYFYPYNYSLDVPWDSTLSNYTVPVATVADSKSLYLLYEKITTKLNDYHVDGTTYSDYYFAPPGYFSPKLLLKYIENKYVVVQTGVAGINIGDAIVSVDGLTTAQWEDSLGKYISAGNPASFRQIMSIDLLGREIPNDQEGLVLTDSTGANYNMTVACNVAPYNDPFFSYSAYDNYSVPDTLATNVQYSDFAVLACDIGYINMGHVTVDNVPVVYSQLQSKAAIIFDLRHYPLQNGWATGNLIYPNTMPFSKFIQPDVTYPGTYYWAYDYLGNNNNANAYTGQVIILCNEQTFSQGEFTCMMLKAMPDAIIVGSQTAGTDGDISIWKLSKDMHTGFTTLGIFYPNGDSTERIGIVPDVVATPTIAGIRHGIDEVLERALQIGCNLAVPQVAGSTPVFSVYPNPSNDIITVKATGIAAGIVTLEVTDITGRDIITKHIAVAQQEMRTSIDVANFSPGTYIVKIQTGDQQVIRKIVKL